MRVKIEKGWIHFGREWDTADESGNIGPSHHDIDIEVFSATEGDIYIRGTNAGCVNLTEDGTEDWTLAISPDGPYSGIEDGIEGDLETIAATVAKQMYFSHPDFET